MEKEAAPGVSGGAYRYLGILPRISAIVLAVILIGVSAGTIGIIINNDILDGLREADNVRLTSDGEDLLNLINRSLAAAGWLIVLGAGVLVAEVVAIILTLVFIKINSPSLSLVVQVIEIVLSIAVAVCYGATGIACAVYAAMWGGPPVVCEENDFFDPDCDEVGLTATNAVSAAFSIIQAVVFGSIAAVVIYTIVKSRSA